MLFRYVQGYESASKRAFVISIAFGLMSQPINFREKEKEKICHAHFKIPNQCLFRILKNTFSNNLVHTVVRLMAKA